MAVITIWGAGSWGAVLGRVLTNAGHRVTVWSHRDTGALLTSRRHPYLPDLVIPEAMVITADMADACRRAEIALMAVPSPYVRQTAMAAAPFLSPGTVVFSASKGIEKDTLLTMTGIMAQELPAGVRLGALSGPSHAEEVALDLPTAVVSASPDLAAAEAVQALFEGSCLRVYTNSDLLGVELCGAVKNIIALAAGVCAGLGYGDNTKAALVTRGMAEIRRLGLAMGCREETFAGLAGIGDLFVTASSPHSRNYRCGQLIGRGLSPEAAAAEIGMVVEGINALPAAAVLSERYRVEMPITRALYGVVFASADPRKAVLSLMARDTRSELEPR
ncbi:MAG: NAD(P)-dependent glycerol-3-phosphate dehydrogenase [Oscillospiraceae bacterium]|nr:NAD(P)-dependent glycerol-3-phosphate dehydrogenase [Oscillospiraceae bacterium]